MNLTTDTEFADLAVIYLERALDVLRSGEDAISWVSAGLACLRTEAGEAEPDYDLITPGYRRDPVCVCPAELAQRGGFVSRCPCH
jgi:hypothetical protein